MIRYHIDDSIKEPLTHSVEVTVELNGKKRWCFFMTPELLASVGDLVEGTDARVHLGVPQMIVVSELNEDIIDRVLRELYQKGDLEKHTVPIV